LVNLGLVYHNLEDDKAAQSHSEQALTIFREIGDRHGQGYGLTYLGHALVGLDELEAAAEAYDEAMRLRRELGQQGLAIDDVAGLARVAMAQDDLERALGRVEEILAWTEDNGSEGIEYPLQVYLTCYHALTATGDAVAVERAENILSEAHDILLEQSAKISDAALRRSFLESVAVNAEIMAIWGKRDRSAG
jgi:tetratricopeptide (TPR) repeat protein